MDIFSVLRLLGGLAMFLYGIEIMGDGLKNSSGAALKRVLEKVTGNVLMGVLTGTLVTAVIQSSTATIVLTVALIGAGVLSLKQAVSIVLGANIGTTITAQLIRLMDIEASGNMFLEFVKPSTLAPIALIIGIILMMFIKTKSSKTIGDIFIGFGILFSGLMNMTAAVEPLSESAEFAAILTQFSNMPLLGITAGLVLTVIIQSSSAMVGMLQALSSTGAMSFSMVYPVVMGINLGTCVTTAMVCSIGSSKDAKRTGMVHILFNTIGTVLFMLVMTIMQRMQVFGPAFWNRMVNSGNIADFQTVFNVITAIVLLPFTNVLVKLSQALVKDEPVKAPRHPELHILDEKLYISPAVALNEATKAVAYMGSLARKNLARSCKMLVDYDPSKIEEINLDEECLDQFADASDHFMIGLNKVVESEAEDRHMDMLMQTVPSFERIGDYATNLCELGERIKQEKTPFSDVAVRELKVMFEAVDEIMSLTLEAFSTNDNAKAATIEPLEEVIDDMVRLLRDRHTKRLKNGKCAINCGLVFMEALTHLERASDQCSSIAMLMLARNNEEILSNHYSYLAQLHEGSDKNYAKELQRRRDQYLTRLNANDM